MVWAQQCTNKKQHDFLHARTDKYLTAG